MKILNMPDVLALRWTLMFAAFLIAAVASEKVVVKKLADEEKRSNLSCYSCYEFENHCLSLVDKSAVSVSTCADEQPFCKVQRLHLREGLLTLERSCSNICVPGCEKAGEYVRCSSCCTKHLCNVDNGAFRTAEHFHLITIIASSTLIYRYLSTMT